MFFNILLTQLYISIFKTNEMYFHKNRETMAVDCSIINKNANSH